MLEVAKGLCFSPDLDPATDGYQGYLAFPGLDWYEVLTIGYDIVLLEVSIDEGGTIQPGELTYIPFEGNQVPRAWSPDGQFLAYYNGTLASGSPIGLAVRRSTVSGHWSLGLTIDAWSPDGQYVAFAQ